ncbi:MAG: hypothetical protein H6Q73_3705 [Firmicutes bacterium]|nr:hypothetical protein [Bacillota bacterium]
MFTSSGTFTVPSGITTLWISMCGGGGGGYGDIDILGAGGGGSSGTSTTSGCNGGAGTQGFVLVEW